LTTNFIAYFWRTLLGYTRESTYSVSKSRAARGRHILNCGSIVFAWWR